jgi:hypothetical protein
MRQARALRDQSPVKAAITAEIAVAVAILTVAPVRAANLSAICLGENLNKPGGPDTAYLLVFPEYDVKNRVDLTFELDEYVTAVVDEYVHDFRPAVMRAPTRTGCSLGQVRDQRILICSASKSPIGFRR